MKRFSFALISACILAMLASCSETPQSSLDVKYLAVQLNEDGDYGIINGDGELVVDLVYPFYSEPSPVSENGVYWVRDGEDEKYQLYSIHSPEEPLCKYKFDAVTNFYCGHACASVDRMPIEIINEEGNVVATLSKNIRVAREFHDGLASVVNQDGFAGYINTKGQVAIGMEYEWANDFSEGLAVVTKKDEPGFRVIDTEGNEKFRIEYDYVDVDNFSDGLLLVQFDDETYRFFDGDGHVYMCLGDEYEEVEPFKGGYAVVQKENENRFLPDFGVMNKSGDMVIPLGKYEYLVNYGNGLFAAVKDDAIGIIDGEDNLVSDFQYNEVEDEVVLDDKLIVTKGSTRMLLNRDGEVMKEIQYYSIPDFRIRPFPSYREESKILRSAGPGLGLR